MYYRQPIAYQSSHSNEIHPPTGYTLPESAAQRSFPHGDHPSRRQDRSEFNPSAGLFRPITPPYAHQQVRAQRGSVYDKPYTNYLDHEPSSTTAYRQQPSILAHRRKDESSRNSEVDFLMDGLRGDRTAPNDFKSPSQPRRTTRRHLLNNLFDILAIAATCVIFGLIYLLIKPFQRGFFCDDTSIQYPIKSDTIPMWLLGVYGGVGPVIIFLIVELWVVRPFNCGHRTNRNSLKQRRTDYIRVIFQTIFLFALGIAICFLITEVGKRTIGRLRPYYLTICDPIWANIQCSKTVITAIGSEKISQYVTDHYCNPTVPAADLQEAKLSFPSGHASYSTYAFVFLFVYFEARLVCPNVQFLKPFLQCLCIAIAFFTCLSRVTDYKHHASDVIGGAIIGFSIAIFAAVRVGTYLWSFSVYCETEEETRKDRLPKEQRIAVPGLEMNQNGVLRSNNEMPLQVVHHSRPVAATTRMRNDNQSGYDHGLHAAQQSNPMHSGPRRIAPTDTYEDENA